MKYEKRNASIKTWAVEDRPRERLVLKGERSLSDAELIAILIGSGDRDRTAVELAREILQSAGHSWAALGRLTIKDLCKHKGIGEAKAVAILAALEIGRRRMMMKTKERTKITTSRDAYEAVKGYFYDLNHEEFWVFCLNRSNQLTQHQLISKGGTTSTVVDVKLIFKFAIDNYASSIIVAHNHPSGQMEPSAGDLQLTQKIKAAGELLQIRLLDHLILSDDLYISLADRGEL